MSRWSPGPAPSANSAETRERMRHVRTRDAGPELAVRSLVHRAGLRYRVDRRLPIPGVRRRADMVFASARVAVFVDGCFWHGCPRHHSPPKSNRAWWLRKVDGNRRRDRHTDRKLRALGWSVVRVWEHEPPDRAAGRIERVVRARTK